MNLLSFIILPDTRFWRVSIPIAYILSLQILTGIPKPDSVQKLNISSLAVRLSEELFQYPFWLQDLSHLPLFFILSWLSHWLFSTSKIVYYKKALYFSCFYAFFNEGIQVMIPDRFPSLGDLIMNLLGTLTGILCYRYFSKK